MNNKIAKGIALILFGILLCIGGADIKATPHNCGARLVR